MVTVWAKVRIRPVDSKLLAATAGRITQCTECLLFFSLPLGPGVLRASPAVETLSVCVSEMSVRGSGILVRGIARVTSALRLADKAETENVRCKC